MTAPDDAGVAPEQAAVTAASRVAAFLDERTKSRGLDAEHIVGFNDVPLYVSDLRALAAAALAANPSADAWPCDHHAEPETCLSTGATEDECCRVCRVRAADRLLAAILPADDGARAAKAEGLREAADYYERERCDCRTEEFQSICGCGVAQTLRDRADSLAADQHADEAGQ